MDFCQLCKELKNVTPENFIGIYNLNHCSDLFPKPNIDYICKECSSKEKFQRILNKNYTLVKRNHYIPKGLCDSFHKKKQLEGLKKHLKKEGIEFVPNSKYNILDIDEWIGFDHYTGDPDETMAEKYERLCKQFYSYNWRPLYSPYEVEDTKIDLYVKNYHIKQCTCCYKYYIINTIYKNAFDCNKCGAYTCQLCVLINREYGDDCYNKCAQCNSDCAAYLDF